MDSEKVKEEFGYRGKPKQWQMGFDALLRHMPDYLKANKEPVADVPLQCGVSHDTFVNGLKELVEMWRETANALPGMDGARWHKCADQLEEYLNGGYEVIEKTKYHG